MESPFHTHLWPHKYFEKFLRFSMALIAAHYIVTNGTDYNIFKLLLDKGYYMEMGFSLVVAVIMVEWINYITLRLDKKHRWEENFPERCIYQFLLGLCVPALFEFFMVAAYFAILAGKNVLKLPFMKTEFRAVLLMLCFFNLYCITRYIYLKWRHARAELESIREKFHSYSLGTLMPEQDPSSKLTAASSGPQVKDGFMVHTLLRSFSVPVEDIAYFYRDAGHVFLRPFDGDDQLLSQSLDQIEKQLDDSRFFRIARHMIVSRPAIINYYPLTFGKLGVTLQPGYKEAVSVSKPLAHNFRLWMDR